MSAQEIARPWYCKDRAVDEYRTTLTEDGEDLPMLKSLKILRAIVVNVGLIAGWFYSLSVGADPTLISALTIVTLGLYNDLEGGDCLALVQAYKEVQTESGNDGN